MNTQEIAGRLVALCREGKYEQAQKELYADDVISIEAEETEGFAKETKGLEAVFEKGRKWQETVVEYHGGSVSDPIVAGASFALTMAMDFTTKNQGRINMTELCVYKVKDGKIISEEFFM